jgi:hypothetical protein
MKDDGSCGELALLRDAVRDQTVSRKNFVWISRDVGRELRDWI